MFDLFTVYVYTVLLLVYYFIYLGCPIYIENKVTEKYRNFRRINRLVANNHTGFFNILYISMCIVFKALWIKCFQYMNNTVTHIEGNTYKITYVIKGQTYIMNVILTRGPKKVLLVCDEAQNDMSDIVFPYLGPEENWHKDIYTPKFFSRDKLVFELSNGEEHVFNHNDKIIL
jgi:hypothetical protein